MTDPLDRRSVLRGTGALVTTGVLAGCGGDGGDGGDGGADDEDGGGTETRDASQEVADYLSDTSNFDGSVVVMGDQDPVTVMVGAEANGGAFGFAPPAIEIPQGTTVEFEWTGAGSTHNVVSDGDGPLDSGSAVDATGVQYEYTFEESGTFLYYCTPHESLGMKGAIVVE